MALGPLRRGPPVSEPSLDEGVREYAARLTDRSTFVAVTLEQLLSEVDALPADLAGAWATRHLW